MSVLKVLFLFLLWHVLGSENTLKSPVHLRALWGPPVGLPLGEGLCTQAHNVDSRPGVDWHRTIWLCSHFAWCHFQRDHGWMKWRMEAPFFQKLNPVDCAVQSRLTDSFSFSVGSVQNYPNKELETSNWSQPTLTFFFHFSQKKFVRKNQITFNFQQFDEIF